MAAKSIRKSVSFDDSDGDRALLDAIAQALTGQFATQQSEPPQSFSDLCKQALRQYLLSREPTQSVILFMELQQQITKLCVRVAALEDEASIALAFNQTEPDPVAVAEPQKTPPQTKRSQDAAAATDDPVLSRLGPLLDDF